MCIGGRAGRSLTERKKCSYTQFRQKSPRAHHVLAVGGWHLAVGNWRFVAVRGSWSWLTAVCGWGLVVDGGWPLVAAGWLAAGGGWWLAVDGPLGQSLRAVLRKKNRVP